MYLSVIMETVVSEQRDGDDEEWCKAHHATSEGGRRELPLHSHKKIPFCSRDVDFSSNDCIHTQRGRERQTDREDFTHTVMSHL